MMIPNNATRAVLFTVLAAFLAWNVPSAAAQALLDPVTHPKFENPLPIPARINATGMAEHKKRNKDKDEHDEDEHDEHHKSTKKHKKARFNMDMRETVQWLGLVAADGTPLMTTVWGYGRSGRGVSFPGPTFVAMRDVPVKIKWKNELPPYNFPGGPGAHLLPVDPNLHLAQPVSGGIPVVTHLHGGHTESASDGLPEQWYTQGWAERGPQFVKKTYRYDNDQEAATLWYHDHTLGITRLNVYAGLAGFYLLRDDNELDLVEDDVLPGGPYEIEIVIQDRMFSADGSLFYPSTDPEIAPGFPSVPAGPSVIAEFFGDFILVNGMAWPKLEVEPRKYRLRFLNGSDSRFYLLEFRDPGDVAQPFMQIGTDDGLLPSPVPLTRLLIAPGERADLVVDFSGQTEIVLKNFGPDEPFKGLNPDGTVSDGAGGVVPPADPATTGRVMKFVVNQPLDPEVPDASVGVGTPLRPPIEPLVQTGPTRNLVLFEGLDEYGRLQPLLGTLDGGSMAWFEPTTENPMLDDIEVWEVYNATEDAHPIHLHLVAFQIINRESFDGTVAEKDQLQHNGTVGVGGKLTVNALLGDVTPPAANEAGWKDTAVMLPGMVTRVIAKFDRRGRYVWHCHILSHEDHEMMRPFHVGPMPMPVSGDVALDAGAPADFALGQNYPNPFNPTTQIRFEVPFEAPVALTIYDVAGREVRNLVSTVYPAGAYVVTWDGKDNAGNGVATGVYFYKFISGSVSHMKKMVILR